MKKLVTTAGTGIAVLASVLLLAGCGGRSNSLPAAPAISPSHASASKATISFNDGSTIEVPGVTKVQRQRSRLGHGDFITVRGKRFIAAYHAQAIRSISEGGRSMSVEEQAPDDGGGGDGGPIGNCGADRQTCPVCDLCSGPVPAGDPSDMSCITSCGDDGMGTAYGRVRVRILDPNVTCTFDLDTGEANCDFEATNTGGGSDPNNHLLHYVRLTSGGNSAYSMECSAFPLPGIATGTFTDHRGTGILFPVTFSENQTTTFVAPSDDSSNTSMNENFYRFPRWGQRLYQGFCRGKN